MNSRRTSAAPPPGRHADMTTSTYVTAAKAPASGVRAQLRELVAHLREQRGALCAEWARRIRQAGFLHRMSEAEIIAETTSVYDNYVDALETGTLRTLQAHARNLSERIIPRGVDTDEVIGIVLLLRDVLARSLFARYEGDYVLLDRVLDAYEPAANRIAITVAVGFVQERDRVRDANIALRRLNERLEEEVRRIARALHDEAGPLLVAIHLALKETGRDASPATRRQLADVRERLNQVEDLLRHLSHELLPPMLQEMGLVAALRFLAEGTKSRRGLHVAVEDRMATRLPAPIETTVYRVVQEGLANVIRHAHATEARISLWIENRALHCVVQDDGVGMKESARRSAGRRGLGLAGMQERLVALSGTLNIHSSSGRGTRLHVRIPLES